MLHNRKELKERRRELRNHPTKAELFLLGYLKNSQLEGRKFRRQHSIGPYVVDFYCPEERLIVELDGEVHYNEEAKKYDEERTEYLESKLIKVIRFENQDIIYNVNKVLNEIKSNYK